MKEKFAERMEMGDSKEIDECMAHIMKLTTMKDVISFAGGLPNEEVFPIEEMKQVSKKVLEVYGGLALQYSATEGEKELKEAIANQIMKASGIEADPDCVMVTCGSQQALEFSGRVFLNPGDVVICENPSYVGAITAFKSYKPSFAEVKMDDDGMMMDDLERVLKENPNTKFIYTVPDFQNPTGKTLPLDRRKKMIELADKYDVLILEDNPYGNLRFEGEGLPAIKSFDKNDRVIFLGTFSKIFCPGLRIGWVYADKQALSQYSLVKQSVDLQTNTMAQKEVAMYMKMFDLKANIEKIIDVYRRKRNLMLKAIEENFPKDCNFTKPNGGLFIWVTLPEYMDASKVLEKAMEKKVGFVPGIAFYANGGVRNNFRLNFSNTGDDEILTGIEILGKVLKDYEIN